MGKLIVVQHFIVCKLDTTCRFRWRVIHSAGLTLCEQRPSKQQAISCDVWCVSKLHTDVRATTPWLAVMAPCSARPSPDQKQLLPKLLHSTVSVTHIFEHIHALHVTKDLASLFSKVPSFVSTAITICNQNPCIPAIPSKLSVPSVPKDYFLRGMAISCSAATSSFSSSSGGSDWCSPQGSNSLTGPACWS